MMDNNVRFYCQTRIKLLLEFNNVSGFLKNPSRGLQMPLANFSIMAAFVYVYAKLSTEASRLNYFKCSLGKFEIKNFEKLSRKKLFRIESLQNLRWIFLRIQSFRHMIRHINSITLKVRSQIFSSFWLVPLELKKKQIQAPAKQIAFHDLQQRFLSGPEKGRFACPVEGLRRSSWGVGRPGCWVGRLPER